MLSPASPAVSARDLDAALARSAARHGRLCPRQVLGVRIGLAGIAALGIEPDERGRPLLVFVETDGCFVSGIEAITGCSVGHHNLRFHDYGKVAATFVDTCTGRAVRVAPLAGVRDIAARYAPDEQGRYHQQLGGYRRMPEQALLQVVPVELRADLSALLGRPGVRVDCSACGEEILNAREVTRAGRVFCEPCVDGGYYRAGPMERERWLQGSSSTSVSSTYSASVIGPASGGTTRD